MTKVNQPQLALLLGFSLIVNLSITGCQVQESQPSTSVANPRDDFSGRWSATLHSPGGALEFELQIHSDTTALTGTIINGEEQIQIDELEITGDRLILRFPHYDSEISADLVSPTELSGTWKKTTGANQTDQMKFSAKHAPRQFTSPPTSDIAGKYRVEFDSSADPAVAIFRSRKNRLDGTFLTTTGDYRYLAGNYNPADKQLTLSCFDGGHAFLFKAVLQPDHTLRGDFWSRSSWHENWTATPDPHAEIADGFQQVKWAEYDLGELKFPDLTGKRFSLDDDRFQGQVKIIQVFGSWCPNCHDASLFLTELQQEFGDQGLSIVGLAFELTGDFDRDTQQLLKYRKRTGASYPILLAGLADKTKATEKIKILSRVKSFPTTIFLDQDDQPLAVHSGFSGPATGAAHVRLKKRFRTIVQNELGTK
jgi:thiol-disulfide isomerase/thioredoxin